MLTTEPSLVAWERQPQWRPGPSPTPRDRIDPREPDTMCALTAHERLLVRAMVAGDSGAAKPLYEYLRPSIDRGLLRILRKRQHDFEDLVQLTFERVVGSVVNFQFRGESQLSTWAHAIAMNVATDWLRKATQERSLMETVDVQLLDERPHPELLERQLEVRSEVRRIEAVLRRMNRINASLLVLHDVCRHTVPELAHLLSLSESAAASRLRRARLEFARRSNKSITPGEREQTAQSPSS